MKIVPYLLMAALVNLLVNQAGIPILSINGVLINLVAFGIMLWTEYL